MDVDLGRHGGRTPVAWLVALVLAGLTFGGIALQAGTPAPTGTPLPSPTAACSAPAGSPSIHPATSTPSSPVPSPGSTAAATSVAPTPATEPTLVTTPIVPPTFQPTAKPTPRPTRTPGAPTPTLATPTPPATTEPSRPSSLVTHGARSSNRVALTFDMGGRVGDALAIVDWLVGHEVHATVFMTGAMADNPNTNAGREALAIVEAHPELFTLGNHSYTHRDFRNLTAAEIRTELLRTEAAIAPFCGRDLRPFFRPPNGGVDAKVLAAVGAAGYASTVTWDVDTIDWRPIANDPPGPTAEQIVAKVLANARGGSIVLMHLGGYETFEALPSIVDGLQVRGFALVNLEELL